jgi:hypothetical protein
VVDKKYIPECKGFKGNRGGSGEAMSLLTQAIPPHIIKKAIPWNFRRGFTIMTGLYEK